MTRRLAGAVILLLALSLVSVGAAATASPASERGPVPADEFVAIGPLTAPVAATGNATPAPSPDLDAVPDFQAGPRSFAPRPAPDTGVDARVIVIPTPTPRPTPRPVVRSTSSGGGGGGGGGGDHRVSGSASWYCLPGVSACHYQYSGGLYAAAGPALRVGDWRGRIVRVCGSGNCVSVKLIDWCGCPSNGRVIDLYSDAFKRLAPLSQGTVKVTVTW